MAKKQTFVVGSTNAVTQSLTDAQLNTAWNQFEVLKAGELDGVLNAMSEQTAINADEITNALDVYNITPDPTDNTQLKQLLTQMDNKIDQAISGGEIIGSFWYGQTTPGFTVPAPTMIGQTYIDFTTLNHYISNDGSTWTLNGTLTLPSTQDAIVLITAKFWDIIEQQNQYGGRAIYSQDLTQWIYYPTIIDLSGYAHTNMDNLDSTGSNIANWSSNVTNCITAIPQDINLELNNGTLTLKAGSKVYIPNGAGTFDEVTIASDINKTQITNESDMFFVMADGTLVTWGTQSNIVSGPTYNGGGIGVWYDTTNNRIRYTTDSGSTWSNNLSLPVCVYTVSGGAITSIDQVFNGLGYIGSTIFALPGIKGLIPNGRNADGTLKNISFITTTVQTVNTVYNTDYANIGLGSSFVNYVSDANVRYDASRNINYLVSDGNQWNGCFAGLVSVSSLKVSSFNPKQVFQSADYLDLIQLIYPVGSIYLGTQSTCPMAALIPGSTWTQIQGRYLLASGTLAGTTETYTAGNTVAAGAPNITGNFGSSSAYRNTGSLDDASGAFQSLGNASGRDADGSGSNRSYGLSFDASRSSSVYGNSTTIRSPAYVVNVWRRVS